MPPDEWPEACADDRRGRATLVTALGDRVRGDFAVASEPGTWLVGGVVNPVPEPVGRRVQRELQEWFTWGAPHVLRPDDEERRRAGMLRVLAASAGVAPADVALVRGVGEGYQCVLRGIDWRPGDRVVLSDDEEGALLLPTLQLAADEGVELDIVRPRAGGVYHAEDFAERFTAKTRLVAFSEVTTEFGSRLPAHDIAAAARAAGCLSFVDVAHSAGLGVTDLTRMGCDAAGLLSYKWHYGPYGLGLLYLTGEARERIRLRYAGGRAHRSLRHPAGPFALHRGTRAYQYGPWLWAMVAGWAGSVEYLAALGWEGIAVHTAALAGSLKRELARVGGVTVETPPDAAASAALVSFSVAGYSSEALAGALWKDAGVRVKARQNSVGVRAGVALFTTTGDVERLLDGVRSLAGRRGRVAGGAGVSPARGGGDGSR